MKKTQMVILASLISIPFIISGCAKIAPESGAASPETGTVAAEAGSTSVDSGTDTAAPAQSLGTVHYGIHQGGSAFSAGFLLSELKLNEKYNFDIKMTVTTGPNVFSALSAGEMDIGFLGNGMAWHYFEKDPKIAILTIDNLTNDDRLIVRKGLGIEEYEPLETLGEKLPGMTLACDLTTTPGTFLKSLVNAINKDKADGDKVWYEDIEGAYPLKGAADKEIPILNTTNANITAVMQDKSIDCCITYGNTKMAIQRDTDNYVIAATTFTHLSDTVTPSTWAVNKEFCEKNPELVQAFVNALVEAMDYRSNKDNWDECIKLAVPFDQLSPEDYDPEAAYWLSKADLKEYFSDDNGQGFTYLQQIRASHMGNNGLDDATALKVDEVFYKDFIRNATAD